MDEQAILKARLTEAFVKTGYSSELAKQIADLFHQKITRKETENDGNDQRTDSGSS
jgi:hypothetical protein